MPLFYDNEACGGLGWESGGLPAKPLTTTVQDPVQLTCVDPQLLGTDFDFGPLESHDLSNLPNALAAEEPFLSANSGVAGLPLSPSTSWNDDPNPPACFQGSGPLPEWEPSPIGTNSSSPPTDDCEAGASKPDSGPPEASRRRTGKSSKCVEDGRNPPTEQATTTEQEITPRKRGRKPRIKTEEEKEQQLQRQRQRNRLAAGRCRLKKKEENQELMQSAERLRKRRDSLRSTLAGLSLEVLDLKEALIKHRYCESVEVEAYIQRQFHQLVGASLKSSSTSQNTTPELVSDDLVFSPLGSPRLSMGSP